MIDPELEKSGVASLVDSIDLFKKTLAKDIERICNKTDGDNDNLVLLSSNNDDKVFNKILKIIDLFDRGRPIQLPTATETIIKTEPTTETVAEVGLQLPVGGNVFETAINHIKKKNGNAKI